jgi:Domain of unknown function (DUF6431)
VDQAPPVAIIWRYPASVSSYVAAGRQIEVPPQRCPRCQRRLIGWGGYWRWLRAPLVVERIWIRRGRCAACRRSHALLPDLALVRRLDMVTVIGTALVLKVNDGLGWRPIAEQLDVPLTTLRTWWPRFRMHAPRLLSTCTRLAVALDGTSVAVHGVAERAAVEVLGLAWQRAHARFGERIGGSVWAFWSRISGGLGLGTHTTSPWAAVPGTDWMRASPPPGGPGP